MYFVLLKLLSRRALMTFSIATIPTIALNSEASEDPQMGTQDRRINYYGAMTSSGLLQLNNALTELALDGSKEEIHLHVQSGGGELVPALYTADLISDISKTTPVTTYVDGYAASAATLLTVSGSRRLMTEHSSFLVHQLSSKHEGTYQELLDQIKNDQLLMRQIVSIYGRHFRGSDAELFALLNRNLLLDAQTCLQLGFVDAIISN